MYGRLFMKTGPSRELSVDKWHLNLDGEALDWLRDVACIMIVGLVFKKSQIYAWISP